LLAPVRGRPGARIVTAPRALYLDDLRPEVSEDLGTEGTGDVLGQVGDEDSREGRIHGGLIIASRRAPSQMRKRARPCRHSQVRKVPPLRSEIVPSRQSSLRPAGSPLGLRPEARSTCGFPAPGANAAGRCFGSAVRGLCGRGGAFWAV